MSAPRPVVLMILDGWGVNPRFEGNALAQAQIPFYRSLLKSYPHTTLDASGKAVGLPNGQMGNSEVGHLNMGAGRIVHQELSRINLSIENGEFFKNSVLKMAMEASRANGSALHLLGLLSDGGVHSHIKHLFGLLELAREERIKEVFIHVFLDGRDTPPQSALTYLYQLEEKIDAIGLGTVATVIGRYYAMDRDKRWDRVRKAYDAIVLGKGESAPSADEAIRRCYAEGITDEFMLPTVIVRNNRPAGPMQDRDAAIFFNFRADRARQLTAALARKNFAEFPREKAVEFSQFVTLTSYDESFTLPTAFSPVRLDNMLGEYLSTLGLKQLRIAETEKYAHVTYFFNGGKEKVYPGEDRVLIPSPQDVATYDEKPEMSAPELTREVVRRIEERLYDLIVLNFANPDMVGHSGNLKAAVAAAEALDRCIEKVVTAALAAGGAVLLTADHGNLEQMIDYQTGEPHTAHTTNPVPLILISDRLKGATLRTGGIHADLAPTILDLMEIPKPKEMDRASLIIH